jgi:DNA-binding response OmpR family regulator
VDAGCNAYLTKPCLPAELHAEVLRVLGRRRAA